jgi:hypothetical protein
MLDDQESIPGRGNDGMFSLRHRVKTDSGDHLVSYPMDTGALIPGVKRPGREADHSTSRLRMSEAALPLFQYFFMA